MSAQSKSILHIDMDCFYAAVETRDNPSLSGKPVIVGAKPGGRGVVSACNYEARKFGIHSAMPISRACQLCPKGVFLDVDMEKYEAESDKIMAILGRYTDRIEPVSVDEAYMDITDLRRLFGTPEQIGYGIKEAIHQGTSLTASVGIAPNKFIAKIASDLNKPDGFLRVLPEDIRPFLDPLPVSRLPGVGEKTGSTLKRIGIKCIRELHQASSALLKAKFGETAAEYLKALAAGQGDHEIRVERESKSVSRERTFQKDTTDREILRQTLLLLTDDVAGRLRRHNLKGRTIALNFRTKDFTRNTRHQTLPDPTNESNLLFRVVEELFYREIPEGTLIRLIGMGVSNFGDEAAETQLDLFQSRIPKNRKQEKLDAARDKIQEKFGDEAITRASLIMGAGLGLRNRKIGGTEAAD